MSDRTFGSVDEEIVERFEQAWLNGQVQDLRSYLPESSTKSYLDTLEELVHIDMEFRWKKRVIGDDSASPPTARDYLQDFPALAPAAIGLIRAEFELANRTGEKITVDQMLLNYSDVVAANELREDLESETLNEQSNVLRSSNALQAGQRLDRYEIEVEHGRGGFGAIWRANDTKLGRRIAVKQLGQQLARNNESRRRFISEARITAKLEHPGIVPVYDMSGVDETYAYYTMRLIQGHTMAEAIKQLHEFDRNSSEFEMHRQRLLRSFVDVCETIEYAHSRGIVHRDIKPQNVILGDFGETILLDWGLAGRFASPKRSTSSIASDKEILTPQEAIETLSAEIEGTPAYMSPEQAGRDFKSIGTASDVYSLGAMLYHIITGELPFRGGAIEELLTRVRTGDLPTARERSSKAPPALSAVCQKAMQVEPGARYSSVRELSDDLKRYLADQPISVFSDPPSVRLFRWIRKNPTATSISALTALFLVVATIVSYFVWSSWQRRELQRVTDLRVAAEKADTAALNQIQNNRFDAAERTLAQALNLTEEEPELVELDERIRARHDRTQQIVRFYKLSRRAQEATFFDQIHRSSLYCQTALQELDVLNHQDWWAHLPQQDLTESQRDQLRTEIYRIIGLLASMRFAEIAKEQISLSMLFQGRTGQDDSFDKLPLQAAAHAAEIGNAYRPARSMKLVIDLKKWFVDNEKGSLLDDMNPQNPIDAAIMGSILDNNQPTDILSRTAMKSILGGRDAGTAAQSWLDAALQYNPEWYWLVIFMGTSEMREGDFRASAKIYSHAIGIQPDYWVGYQYRSVASVLLARTETDEDERTMLLNSALHDLQRAFDLSRTNSDPYWTYSLVLSEMGAPPSQVIGEFLNALSLHHRLDQTTDGHYSGISQLWFNESQRYVDYLKGLGQDVPELRTLELALLCWNGAFDKAVEFIDESDFESLTADEAALLAIAKSKTNQISNNDIERDRDKIAQSVFAWSANHAIARFLTAQEDWQLADSLLKSNLERKVDRWQHAMTCIALAEVSLQENDEASASQYFQQAIEADLAVNVESLSQQVESQNNSALAQVVAEHLASLVPFVPAEENSITQPALMNRGFELGLSYYWSPYDRRSQQGAWKQSGGSISRAEITQQFAHTGESSLWISNDSEIEDAFAELTQTFPVSPGKQYRIEVWTRGKDLNSNAVQILIDDKPFAVKAGSYDWTKQSFEFTTEANQTRLSIRSIGTGQVWLDDFNIVMTAAN